MNKRAALALTLAPMAALASVGSVAVTQVDAAETLTFTEVVYDYDGTQAAVGFSDLSSAMLDGDGDMYDFVTSNQISALGLSNGEYITYMDYASAVLDGDEVTEILADLSEDPIDDSTVEDYQALEGFTGGGEPIIGGETGNEIVPEVISIK
ncbi:hypothetical protein LCM20_10295 [Halobacillus litoralis]|uniref:hypothetical protein n=1 Tax=Halobacillus litoralis TaxID=45668 RepID=UPI001CD28D77|nr:hypothetical protein [Halobacillus litoralis]MCA0970981.1 hypothetical protein [Halobacillus litoralis]